MITNLMDNLDDLDKVCGDILSVMDDMEGIDRNVSRREYERYEKLDDEIESLVKMGIRIFGMMEMNLKSINEVLRNAFKEFNNMEDFWMREVGEERDSVAVHDIGRYNEILRGIVRQMR